MLQPKRTKFRKAQKGRSRGIAHRGSTVAFGSFALKTLEPGWITSRQIPRGSQTPATNLASYAMRHEPYHSVLEYLHSHCPPPRLC